MILFDSVKFQPMVMGKSWQQELKGAHYIIFAVRKQREMGVGAQLTFSSFCSLYLPLEVVQPLLKVLFPLQSVSLKTRRHAQRLVSWEILDPVNLTISVNHHSRECDLLQMGRFLWLLPGMPPGRMEP